LNAAPSVVAATEGALSEAPATLAASEPAASKLAASDDEPLFATKAATNGSADSTPATEAAAHSDDVTSRTSQESHV